METDFPAPELSLTDLNELHNDLIEMQRVVILCTIALIAAFVIIVPPLIYLYFRKAEKGIWLLKKQNDNLLEYYQNIQDKECSDKKSIV